MMATSYTELQLRELINRARDEGKWLWCHYQDLWFSPDQLTEQNAQGKFLWGPLNWKLRDPQEHVNEADARAHNAAAEAARVRASIRS